MRQKTTLFFLVCLVLSAMMLPNMTFAETEPLKPEKLKEILLLHHLRADGKPGGVQADLAGANLAGANLFEADLRGAILEGANLEGAIIEGTKGLPN